MFIVLLIIISSTCKSVVANGDNSIVYFLPDMSPNNPTLLGTRFVFTLQFFIFVKSMV